MPPPDGTRQTPPTPVVPIEKNKVGSVAVSSDGRRLLYTQPDETDSDIMLLDNGG